MHVRCEWWPGKWTAMSTDPGVSRLLPSSYAVLVTALFISDITNHKYIINIVVVGIPTNVISNPTQLSPLRLASLLSIPILHTSTGTNNQTFVTSHPRIMK